MYILSLVALAVFATTVSAQAPTELSCRWRFAVVQQTDSVLDLPEVWPSDAKEWWAKEGIQKFPELCEAARHDADFIVVWRRKWTTERVGTAITRRESRPIRRRTCDPPDERGATQCWDYDDYEEFESVEWEYHEEQIEQLSATVFWTQTNVRTFGRVASVTKKGSSFWGARPGKAAFDSALKTLRKEAKKAESEKIRE